MSTAPDLKAATPLWSLSSSRVMWPSGKRETREPLFSSPAMVRRVSMPTFSRSTGMQRKC